MNSAKILKKQLSMLQGTITRDDKLLSKGLSLETCERGAFTGRQKEKRRYTLRETLEHKKSQKEAERKKIMARNIKILTGGSVSKDRVMEVMRERKKLFEKKAAEALVSKTGSSNDGTEDDEENEYDGNEMGDIGDAYVSEKERLREKREREEEDYERFASRKLGRYMDSLKGFKGLTTSEMRVKRQKRAAEEQASSVFRIGEDVDHEEILQAARDGTFRQKKKTKKVKPEPAWVKKKKEKKALMELAEDVWAVPSMRKKLQKTKKDAK